MTLKEYLQAHNLSVHQFSYLSKLSAPVIYRVLNEANIAPKSAKRIYNITNGEVNYKHIMSFKGALLINDDYD